MKLPSFNTLRTELQAAAAVAQQKAAETVTTVQQAAAVAAAVVQADPRVAAAKTVAGEKLTQLSDTVATAAQTAKNKLNPGG